MAAAAREAWQTAAPRRKRSAARRPRPGEAAAARGPEAEPEVDGGVVLRRIQEAGACSDSGHVHLYPPAVTRVGTVSDGTASCAHVHTVVRRRVTVRAILKRLRDDPAMFFIREDLLVSDFWSAALETITKCLTKYLEQPEAPAGTLSEALGNLHLGSSDESAVAPGCIPRETLVTGTCHWKCVGYGLGNFSTCVIARSQLTFLLLFLEKCQIPRSHCWVYDPLFTQLEIAVLNTLGVTVVSENEEGKRSVCGERTIFYMLHCGTALYNNLLWSNWSVDALSKMVIIGNSFRGLEERSLTRILQKNYAYIAKIRKGLEEYAFPQTSQYMDVFNDTSIHWFPVQKLSQLSMCTWAFQEEPDYQDCEDLEIIRNKTEGPSAADSDSLHRIDDSSGTSSCHQTNGGCPGGIPKTWQWAN